MYASVLTYGVYMEDRGGHSGVLLKHLLLFPEAVFCTDPELVVLSRLASL